MLHVIMLGLLLAAGEPAADSSATAVAKQRLAVLELKAEGASAELATTLSQVVAEQAGKTPGFDAISQAEISSLLNVEKQRQLLGCADESCLAEIGGALGAKLVLSGTLGKLEDSYVLSLQLLDTRRAKIQSRESRTVTGSLEVLVAAAKDLTHRLLTGKPLDTTGKIRFALLPPGAALTIDGTLVGHAPLDGAITLEQGTHRVHAEKDGYIPYDNTLEVVAGSTLFNEINLVSTKQLRAESPGATQRTLGWILIGAAALTAGAGVYLGVKAQDNYNSYTNATYKTGNGSNYPGAQYYQSQTQNYANPANICYAVAGGLGVVGVGFEIWGIVVGSSGPEKHVEVVR